MTLQEKELAAKYQWRIKYPKTFEMAVRNKFLDGELPPVAIAPEIVRQLDVTTIGFQAFPRKRQTNNLGTDADHLAALPVSELKVRRRGKRNLHAKLARGPAQQDDIDTKACIKEILNRLTWIESALSAVLEE